MMPGSKKERKSTDHNILLRKIEKIKQTPLTNKKKEENINPK